MTPLEEVSAIDRDCLTVIRSGVVEFMKRCARDYDREDALLLDVAPQVHEGARPYFLKARIKTLDLDPNSGADFIADLCKTNRVLIDDDSCDLIVCTEVLEHTLNPFAAVAEIYRILKPGGLVFVTTPFNFRIHGPLPDCWRFTVHGLRTLFNCYELIDIEESRTPDRPLMPIQYRVIARKPGRAGRSSAG